MITLLLLAIFIFIAIGAILWMIYDTHQTCKELQDEIDKREKKIALLKILYALMEKTIELNEQKQGEE